MAQDIDRYQLSEPYSKNATDEELEFWSSLDDDDLENLAACSIASTATHYADYGNAY